MNEAFEAQNNKLKEKKLRTDTTLGVIQCQLDWMTETYFMKQMWHKIHPSWFSLASSGCLLRP